MPSRPQYLYYVPIIATCQVLNEASLTLAIITKHCKLCGEQLLITHSTLDGCWNKSYGQFTRLSISSDSLAMPDYREHGVARGACRIRYVHLCKAAL